jgi:hypothetical protein
MKGLSLIGVFVLSPSILAMAILGYISLFYSLSWLWFFVALGLAVLAVAMITTSKLENKYGVYYEALGGGFGWIWMLSIPANIWFIIDALFLEGAWTQLLYGVLVGGFSKAMLRGTMQAKSDL